MTPTPVLLLDGGLGTSLEDEYGCRFTEATPLWSSDLLLSKRDTLKSCQSDFARIPVDILLTATYQVSVEGFQRTRAESFPNGVSRTEIPSFLDDAVAIAEQVKLRTTSIALSLGPYGAVMTPSQEYSAQYDEDHSSAGKLFRWHAERISLFAGVPRLGARINFIAFETIPRLDEILALRQLTALPTSDSTDQAVLGPLVRIPYWISCLFPDGQTLPDGSSATQVVRAMLSLQHSKNPPWGIGINCTKIANLPGVVRAYRESVKVLEEDGLLDSWPSLLLYPDGTNGEVYNVVTKTWGQPTEQKDDTVKSPWEAQLAEIATQEQSRGCWRTIVVGGCCKATSSAISRLRDRMLGEAVSDHTEKK